MDKMKQMMENRNEGGSQRYNKFSKEKLAEILKTKLTTTFIGDISIIEEIIGYLWGAGLPESKLTENQRKWKKAWGTIRKRILDNGNDQIRAVMNELEQYEVKWNRYKTKMDVVPETRVIN